MKTLDQLTYLPAWRRARIDERTRQLIAKLYAVCGNTEVSGEVAKPDVDKVVNNAPFHRDNQK